MDLLTLFDDIDSLPKAALDALKDGQDPETVASTHIAQYQAILERNAGGPIDPVEVAYALEYVLLRSEYGKNPL